MKLKKQRAAKKSPKLKETDKRFLKAVDFVLSNKAEYKFKSARAVSLRITNDASTFAKIKNGTRGVTLDMLLEFGNYFNLDFNYFFRGKAPQDYLLNVVEVEEDKNTYILESLKNLNATNTSTELQEDIRLLEQLILAGKEQLIKVEQIIQLFSEEIRRIQIKKSTNVDLQRLLKEAENTNNTALKKYLELKGFL